jgi:hypothetical protein
MKDRNISEPLCSTTDLWFETRCCSPLPNNLTHEDEEVSVRNTKHFLAFKIRQMIDFESCYSAILLFKQ